MEIEDIKLGETKSFRHSLILAYLAWGTVFGIIWLLLFEIISLSGMVWGFWGFSVLIALCASLLASSK